MTDKQIKKYRKKPVEIEAIQLTKENQFIVCDFCQGKATVCDSGLMIETLEGVMLGEWGDYIIKGIIGEFYPCKLDIFERTYDEVNNDR